MRSVQQDTVLNEPDQGPLWSFGKWPEGLGKVNRMKGTRAE